jgi:hypothetical protein
MSDLKYQELHAALHHWQATQDDGAGERKPHLYAAIHRSWHAAISARLLACTLRVEGRLAAVMIQERLAGCWCLGHFLAVDPCYYGISDYFLHRVAAALLARGGRYLNLEQDLGLAGLRRWKTSWRPICYLRKYMILSQPSTDAPRVPPQ